MQKAFRVPFLALPTAVAALALLCASASAQITVGQVAPPNPEVFCGSFAPFDEFQTAVGAGASYAVPAPGGLITSWSTSAGPGLGQKFEMKVFRPLGPSTYAVVAHDGPRPLLPSALNTFPVSIPVQAGDIVGMLVPSELETTETACAFATGNPLDRSGWKEGNAPDGSSFTVEEETEFRENVSATVLPPPLLSALLTGKGTIKGGTPVVIAGLNLAEVRAVSFGAVPATSFTVDSEAQITAIAPPSSTLSKVPVTVTTGAGTATSATTFAYEGCKVPKLAHGKLKASKRKLKKGDCRLGKVKKLGDATAKTGEVVKQNPKPGKILAPGSKVTIKLG
ncbi:MAG: PASTA domain-containing protein [Solirubrobacterales bacterium]